MTTIARAKNELGDQIARLQVEFNGFPTIEEQNRIVQELDAQ